MLKIVTVRAQCRTDRGPVQSKLSSREWPKGGECMRLGAVGKVAILAATMIAVGCAGSTRGLKAAPEKGVDLSGQWRLNAGLSDNSQKIVKERWEETRGRGRDRGTEGRPVGGALSAVGPTSGARVTRFLSPRMPAELEELARSPERLTVFQEGSQLRIEFNDTDVQYRAGVKSVVSYGRGVADRSAGWKGRTFIVVTKAVDGARQEKRFELDDSGRLIISTELSGWGGGKIKMRQVYDRVSG